VARFIALFGDMVVGKITRPQVIEFRDLVTFIPLNMQLAKIERSGGTLRTEIEAAREKRRLWVEGGRNGPEPERVAPGTVKKDVGALSQILGKIQKDALFGSNVAEKIEIAGYSKTRAGQKKPHLPLTPAMIQALFDSPMFTGCAGIRDADRAKPGIHIFQDELYWLFLFGAMSGPRLREIGQLRIDDIHHCDMRRTFGEDYEGSCTFVHITGTGVDQEVKNDGSDRYVVLHDRLIELGFNDFVAHRRARGKETLFDLLGTSGASPTKTLSNRLNRYFDRTVSDDPRYVFHSTRHEFTDRAELSEIPARVAKRIKGHALTEVADKYGLVSIFAQWWNLKKLNVSFIDWDRLIAARDRAPAGDRFTVRRPRPSKS
jgi:integrase